MAEINNLTPRETEIMELVCEGLTNREIGEKLGISPRTAEIHAFNIRTKMRARNMTHAAVKFVRKAA